MYVCACVSKCLSSAAESFRQLFDWHQNRQLTFWLSNSLYFSLHNFKKKKWIRKNLHLLSGMVIMLLCMCVCVCLCLCTAADTWQLCLAHAFSLCPEFEISFAHSIFHRAHGKSFKSLRSPTFSSVKLLFIFFFWLVPMVLNMSA